MVGWAAVSVDMSVHRCTYVSRRLPSEAVNTAVRFLVARQDAVNTAVRFLMARQDAVNTAVTAMSLSYSDFGSSEHLSMGFRRAPPGFNFGQEFELRFDSGFYVHVRPCGIRLWNMVW